MANIFLSYVREDAGKARSLAAILERAGHSVWWDRQIKGGAQYSAEIEAALDAAEKVVVLWSAKAITSAWVRDEAAAGRDTGRLVPITLDGTAAPLGFRQFQTLDLSDWNGRSSAPGIKELQEALGSTTPRITASPASSSGGRHFKPSRVLLIGATAALAAVLITGVVFFWLSGRNELTPRIVVTSADGSSLSRQAAHDLAVALAQLTGADASNYDLVDASAAPVGKADLVLTVAATSAGGTERRDLVLRGFDQAMLWSGSIDHQAGKAANLIEQAAVKAQRALSCAAEALSYRREVIRQDTVKLYLTGCTNFDSAYGTNVDDSAQINLFRQVLAKAPHFEPAWTKLLLSEIDDLDSADDPRSVQREMASQIARAQGLGLDFGELYAAKAAILSPVDFVGIFKAYNEGIRRHPDNAALFAARAERFLYVGRLNQAVSDSSRAVQLDGLSPAYQQSLASTYAYAGNADAAYAQLRKAEELWPGAPAIVNARYRLDLRYGDPREALTLLKDTAMGPLQPEQTAFLRARINPTPENIANAIAEDRKIFQQYPDFIAQIVQTLAQFGRKDEVLDILLHYPGGDQAGLAAEVLFRPAMRDVWRDPRSIGAAAHLGLLHYWKVSGNWPDFCADPALAYNCKKEAAKYRV